MAVFHQSRNRQVKTLAQNLSLTVRVPLCLVSLCVCVFSSSSYECPLSIQSETGSIKDKTIEAHSLHGTWEIRCTSIAAFCFIGAVEMGTYGHKAIVILEMKPIQCMAL